MGISHLAVCGVHDSLIATEHWNLFRLSTPYSGQCASARAISPPNYSTLMKRLFVHRSYLNAIYLHSKLSTNVAFRNHMVRKSICPRKLLFEIPSPRLGSLIYLRSCLYGLFPDTCQAHICDLRYEPVHTQKHSQHKVLQPRAMNTAISYPCQLLWHFMNS